MAMDFNDFKILHSETIMYYQIIEHDLKYIYSYMLKGDVAKHLNDMDNKTLGQMIKILKDLDFSDGKPLISSGDYNFLSQICENRNLWAHKTYTEFIYIQNFIYSPEYQKQCDKLIKDHDRVEKASKIVEDIRIDYCTRHRR